VTRQSLHYPRHVRWLPEYSTELPSAGTKWRALGVCGFRDNPPAWCPCILLVRGLPLIWKPS